MVENKWANDVLIGFVLIFRGVQGEPSTSYKWSYNPYKAENIWVFLGLFHPYIL